MMECKFCHAPLEEGQTTCPACGMDNVAEEAEAVPAAGGEDVSVAGGTPVQETPAEAEEAPMEGAETPAEPAGTEVPPEKPKKKKTGLIAGIAVLAVIAIGLVLFFCLRGKSGMGTTDINAKESYTEDDITVAKASSKTIAQMDGKELTNSQLQVFYWMEYYNFLSNYGSVAYYFGLDTTCPLDQQASMTEGMTWEQFFLDGALASWAQFQSMCLDAEAAGFEMDADLRAELDQLKDSLSAQAESYGFASVDEMVQEDFGPDVTFEDYQNYMELYYTAYLYFNDLYSSWEPSQEELSDYYDNHTGTYAEEGLEKNEMPAAASVRHILITPEGGETGADGYPVYTDEAWAAAEEAAQAVYDQWLAGDLTEDAFADLAVQYSADGNASTGGLYEDVEPGQMVTEFNDWCFDTARACGDTGIVKTVYGYHIMYFVSASEDLYWASVVRSDYLNEKAEALVTGTLEAHPYEADFSAIVLGMPSNVSSSFVEQTEPTETAALTE